jgi:hypothetical protein
MDRSTRLALATGATLVFGALIFILMGDGIIYFSSFFAGSPGSSFGSSLVTTGYVVLAIVVISFILAVVYLVHRSTSSSSDSWSSW